MMYTTFFITVFIILMFIEENLNVYATPIENAEERILSKDEITFQQLNNILSDSTVFDKNLIILYEQLKSKNLSKVSVNNLILEEFKNIELILQDLDSKFNKKPKSLEFLDSNEIELKLRPRRSVPRAASRECKISHEMLTNLKIEINNALQNTSQTSSINCELNNDAFNCDDLFKYVECGINGLKNGFIIATSKGSTSDEFIAWKTSFETLSAAYIKLSDNVERTTEQMYKKEIENLKTTIQLLLHIITILENSPCVVNVVIEV